MLTTLLVSSFPPFPTLTLTLPSDTPVSDIPLHLPAYFPSFAGGDLSLSLPSGALSFNSEPISSLHLGNESSHDDGLYEELSSRLVTLRLTPRLRGGKGGFGSQLRAAGGRMSSQKTSNNDSCRDLNGRRLSTIKEAKALASYLESEPERKKAQQEAQKAKLERLERKLGIAPGEKGKEKEDASAGVKRRFDDTEYIEQSREIVDSVKNAVAAGLLKKKKKAKTSPSPDAQSSSKAKSEASRKPAEITESLTEKGAEVVESILESPATAPVVAVAAASLAAVGA